MVLATTDWLAIARESRDLGMILEHIQTDLRLARSDDPAIRPACFGSIHFLCRSPMRGQRLHDFWWWLHDRLAPMGITTTLPTGDVPLTSAGVNPGLAPRVVDHAKGLVRWRVAFCAGGKRA